jgi:O-antigen/teichoic acid export membrane protein
MQEAIRIGKEFTWIILGQAVAFVGSLLLVRILTDNLATAEYGELALVLSFSGVVFQVVMGAINNGISRFYSISMLQNDVLGYLNASYRLVISGTAVVTAATFIVLVLLYAFDSFQWFWLIVATLTLSLITSYNNALNAIQNAARQRIVVAFHTALQSILKLLLVFIVFDVFDSTNSTIIIVSYSIVALVVVFSQSIFLKRLVSNLQEKKSDNLSTTPNDWYGKMIKFSLPFSYWGIFSWAQSISDRWALETFSSIEEVGQFAVVYQVGYGSIIMLNKVATSLISPILYERSGELGQTAKTVKVHKTAWHITYAAILVSLLAWIVVIFSHQDIFKILVAPEYQEVSKYLPWLILAGGLFSSGQVLSIKILSELSSKKLLPIKIITAILAVLLNFLGAAQFGLAGVVGAMVLFSTIYLVWVMVTARNQFSTNNV